MELSQPTTQNTQPTTSLTRSQRIKLLQRIKKLILKHHVNVSGIDYQDWAATVEKQIPELLACGMEGFEEGVREILSQLGTSHTVFYRDREIRLLSQHSINATVRALRVDGQERWMFLDIFEGGPADAAGIRAGDLLLALNGQCCEPPIMPKFGLGSVHRLRVSDIRGGNCREISIDVPKRKGTKQKPPIVEPRSLSHRVIAPGIGLLRITYFPGAMGMRFARVLDAAIEELKHHGCDRLIIDLRGNIGGSLGFARLASYLYPGKIPIGNSVTPWRSEDR